MTEPELPKKPLVLITWKDSCAEGGWADVDPFHGPAICYQVGWIWKEDDEGMTLVAGYSPPHKKGDHSCTGSLHYILKSCIIKRQILKTK
jgi:hypothetical protein